MEFYSTAVAFKTIRFYATLDEAGKRRFAGLEAEKLGHGGGKYIRDLLGCDFKTIKKGADELGSGIHETGPGKIRKAGGGRKSKVGDGRVNKVFLKVITKHTAGSPEDANLRWTYLNQEEIVSELRSRNVDVSRSVVRQLLPKHGYVKRRSQKKNYGRMQKPK